MKVTNGMWVPNYDRHAKSIDEIAEITYSTLIEFIPGRELAIDAGAHVGFWAQRMTRHFDKVMAFEPDHDNYACLSANMEDEPDVEAFNMALGSSTSVGKIRHNLESQKTNSGAKHIVDAELMDGGQAVHVVALDDLVKDPVSLIKIDVEGMEHQVLRGARNIIMHSNPAIIIERNKAASENYKADDDAAHKLLTDWWGYEAVVRKYNDYLYLRS